MKRNLIANLSKITISILLIPVWFLKIFQGVGHLRSDENSNEIKEVLFYHSPFENIFDMELGVLFYISIIFIISPLWLT